MPCFIWHFDKGTTEIKICGSQGKTRLGVTLYTWSVGFQIYLQTTDQIFNYSWNKTGSGKWCSREQGVWQPVKSCNYSVNSKSFHRSSSKQEAGIMWTRNITANRTYSTEISSSMNKFVQFNKWGSEAWQDFKLPLGKLCKRILPYSLLIVCFRARQVMDLGNRT